MSGDYIKLSRKILEWDWYTDLNTCRLFIHMILKANWKEGNFRGKIIPRGSFVSSIGKLSEETGLTQDEVRTAVKHLISTKEITKQSTNKYTVFTVNNYESYQCVPKQDTEELPSNTQAIPNLFPTIEEKKEGKKEIYKETPKGVKKFAPPTAEQVREYCKEKGLSLDTERFIDYYTANGWMIGKNKMKDWKATVRNWVRQGRTTNSSTSSKTKFSNFEERSEDFDAIERELLGGVADV